VRTPTLADLVNRPTAKDVEVRRGDPIWYRQIVVGGYGRGLLVPGTFERYGAIRVAVVLVDATGGEHRVYVSPLNVYRRLVVDTLDDRPKEDAPS
jgi:hypothetical protein